MFGYKSVLQNKSGFTAVLKLKLLICIFFPYFLLNCYDIVCQSLVSKAVGNLALHVILAKTKTK